MIISSFLTIIKFMEYRTKFARFIDNFVLTAIFMVFTFLFLQKYIKILYISIGLSVFMGFVFIKSVFYFQFKRYSKLGVKKEELKNIEHTNITLRKLTYNQQIIYLKKLFSKFNPKLSGKFIMLDNDIFVINKLDQSNLSIDAIYEIYARTNKIKVKPKEVAIVCNNVDQSVINQKNKLGDINISFLTPEYIYALSKKYNCEIKNTPESLKQINFKPKMSKLFMKKQSRYFIRCGLFLYLTSLMVPFSRYYIISASIFLLVGAVCLIFGTKEIKLPKSQLL